MRLMTLLCVAMMALSTAAYADPRPELDGRGNPKPMSEREYNRQKKDMEREKKELLDRRAKANSQSGSAAAAGSGAPAPKEEIKERGRGNSQAATENNQGQGGSETVIRRKSDKKPARHDNANVTLNLPKPAQTCRGYTGFGVCPNQ